MNKGSIRGFAWMISLSALYLGATSIGLADPRPTTENVHTESANVQVCATVQKFAGDAVLLDPSRAHVDDAKNGRAIPCDGWVSVRTGWIEIKHRDGHLIRMGENTFIQLNGEQESLTLLRGVIHVQAFDDGANLRMITPNARAKMKQGNGILLYSPERQRTQWVTLSRLAMLENRFESETQVTVGEGEGSLLDLSQARVVPMAPRAITVASLKPLLKSLDLSEKMQKGAIYVALQRQRRVIPSILGEAGLLGGNELRAPASVEQVDPELYRRHNLNQRDAKIERHLAQKQTGGGPTSLLEPEALEKRLEAKAAARDSKEKKRIIEELEELGELERHPASEGE